MRKILLSLAFALSALNLAASPAAVAAGYDGERDSDNRPHGWGVYVYPGGGRYEGQWQFGEKAGRGIREWRDGSRYDGQWQHNMPHGKGVMTYAGGGSYRGDFRAGKRSGRGVETQADGSEYSGHFRADFRHGTGTLVLRDGSRYEGSWMKGVKQGEGLLVKADGTAFKGVFMAGKPDGKGECLAGGVVTPCRFEQGKPVKPAVAPPAQLTDAAPAVVDAAPELEVRALRARGSLVPPPQGTAAVKAARAAASAVSHLETTADAVSAAGPAPAVVAVTIPPIAGPAPVEVPVSLDEQLQSQGSGMFFEHDFPALSLAGAASHGWWRKSVALFGGGLELIVVKGGERLLLRIPSYKGPGVYAADDVSVTLVTADGRFVSTAVDGGQLVIENDTGGWISGSFESLALESVADGSPVRLSRGVFRLADEMPQVASALVDL